MEREYFQKLEAWKAGPDRKPLVLKGARQVGKTWLMREFGRRYYRNTAYFNFDTEPELRSIFETNKNPHRIIDLLAMIGGTRIDPGETLILFDEVQECPNALNSLKYFMEEAGEYHVMAAGSLLGTLLAQPKSYPVGKVNLMEIAPLTFSEFLREADPFLYRYYAAVEPGQMIETLFHERLMEWYRSYLIIGGMPECVVSWLSYKDPERLRGIQHDLIEVYENDFSKYHGRINSGRLLMVFRSIVPQLAKENEKFIYGALREGARAREFEEAVEWLVSAGMLNRVYNASKPEHPLPAYDRLDCFKLYLFDTGLLTSMAGVDPGAILTRSDFQFKGPLTENYVLQQLKSEYAVAPRYYADKNREIDFLVQLGQHILPVEVKAGEDKSAPSFKRYIAEHHPAAAIRFSAMGYLKNGSLTNFPLYLAGRESELLKLNKSEPDIS